MTKKNTCLVLLYIGYHKFYDSTAMLEGADDITVHHNKPLIQDFGSVAVDFSEEPELMPCGIDLYETALDLIDEDFRRQHGKAAIGPIRLTSINII